MRPAIIKAMFLLCCLIPAMAQGIDLKSEVSKLSNGSLALSYASRDGVHGNADHLSLRTGQNRNISSYHNGCYDDDQDSGPGDILAVLEVRKGQVRSIELSVLSPGTHRAEADRDVGNVPSVQAAAFFLEIAEADQHNLADDILVAIVMARDVQPAQDLVRLARNRGLSSDLRESALFWMALLAGDKVAGDVRDIIDDSSEDIELRTHAIFALTQFQDDRAFPMLMDVARTHAHPEIKSNAYFWLAQYDRPEVVNLFEEILVGD
jgi:hypothetical protein